MATFDELEQDLSHYLWSLDTTLSNLISLSNEQRSLSHRIIKEVDERLTAWTAHKSIISTKPPLISSDDDNGFDDEETKRTQSIEPNPDPDRGPNPGANPSAYCPPKRSAVAVGAVRAWGDCSDDEDDDFLFPEPKGLCKANGAKPPNPMPLSSEPMRSPKITLSASLRTESNKVHELNAEVVEHKEFEIEDMAETKCGEMDCGMDSIHFEVDCDVDAVNKVDLKEDAVDISNIEIDDILSVPLFIDDTQSPTEIQSQTVPETVTQTVTQSVTPKMVQTQNPKISETKNATKIQSQCPPQKTKPISRGSETEKLENQSAERLDSGNLSLFENRKMPKMSTVNGTNKLQKETVSNNRSALSWAQRTKRDPERLSMKLTSPRTVSRERSKESVVSVKQPKPKNGKMNGKRPQNVCFTMIFVVEML